MTKTLDRACLLVAMTAAGLYVATPFLPDLGDEANLPQDPPLSALAAASTATDTGALMPARWNTMLDEPLDVPQPQTAGPATAWPST